jgi:hypothetical protein
MISGRFFPDGSIVGANAFAPLIDFGQPILSHGKTMIGRIAQQAKPVGGAPIAEAL